MIKKFKVQSSKFKVNEGGFALVELLAAIVVLVVIGGITSAIITSSLRGTNKANIIESIRQNGNSAITQISKTIEYAKTFNGLSIDGITYVTSCPFPFPVSPTPVPIPNRYNYLKVTPFGGGNAIVYNCTSASFTSDGVSVIDDSIKSNIALKSCSITCIQNKITDVPIIKINLTLEPKNNKSLLENSTPPISFETSVTVRNYKH